MFATKRLADQTQRSRGFGDSIAKLTKLLGVEPCGGCEQRRQTLNRLFPYRNQVKKVQNTASSSVASSNSAVSAESLPTTVVATDSAVEVEAQDNFSKIWVPSNRFDEVPNLSLIHI